MRAEDPIPLVVMDCAGPYDYPEFNKHIHPDEDCLLEAQKIIKEITTLRMARKAVRWMEESRILERGQWQNQ